MAGGKSNAPLKIKVFLKINAKLLILLILIKKLIIQAQSIRPTNCHSLPAQGFDIDKVEFPAFVVLTAKVD